MECPLCGSSRLRRESGSPRTWGLFVVGTLLAVLGYVVVPGMTRALAVHTSQTALNYYHAVDMKRGGATLRLETDFSDDFKKALQTLTVGGLMCIALGIVDHRLDKRRWCADCGFRGCFSGGPVDARTREALGRFRESTERGSGDAAPPAPDQPVEPLLKMLRFKNEEMRKQAARTLRTVTGRDFGTDADAWERWWAEEGKSLPGPSENTGDAT